MVRHVFVENNRKARDDRLFTLKEKLDSLLDELLQEADAPPSGGTSPAMDTDRGDVGSDRQETGVDPALALSIEETPTSYATWRNR